MSRTQEIASAITTLLLSAVTIINLCLQLKGLPAIELNNQDLSITVNAILAVFFGVYAWWKNNNITAAAFLGQVVTDSIKDGTAEDILSGDDDDE